jgi:hypothetical protein
VEITATAYPLYWPEGWKRTPQWKRDRSRFGRHLTIYVASQDVLEELRRLGASQTVLSTNLRVRSDGIPYSGQKIPADTGVAVWFKLGGEQRVLACDRWLRIEENLRAIALHIQALRGMDRWGVGNVAQAFAGFTALPERAGGLAWWEVLGYDPEPENLRAITAAEIEERFRKLALVHHPDRGGNAEKWHELQEARAQALATKQ